MHRVIEIVREIATTFISMRILMILNVSQNCSKSVHKIISSKEKKKKKKSKMKYRSSNS